MPRTNRQKSVGGFTLIELMVAMVIGLIVIGAVLALSLSMIRANTGTIASTRLTQELRATAALIASELQRTGSAENPFNAKVVQFGTSASVVDTDTANCIKYGFFSSTGDPVRRSIYLHGGAVYLRANADVCTGGTKLSSDNVVITALDFAPPNPAAPTTACTVRQQICFRLEGHLSADSATKRSYFQTVFAPAIVPPVPAAP